MPGPRIRCVGAVITDGAGRLLLIRRRNDPGAGLWSLPGGKIEPGESPIQAVIREVREETGLIVLPGRMAGTVELPGAGDAVIEVRDYLASIIGGSLIPGDDATDARWVTRSQLSALPVSPGLAETLSSWGVLP